jgi:riboflavin kinase / FMN adenylyltransferase
MEILRHYEGIPKALRGAAAALGNFDGFHRGHQAVVGEAGRIARQEKIPLAVVVSEPHPRTFFNPQGEPFRLTGFRERLALFETFGVDVVLVLPFTRELASFPPERFVADVLHDGLALKHVVVGYDYRFGKGRIGDVAALKTLGAKSGIAVHEIAPVPFGAEGDAGAPYSSTLVRDALKQGEARKAAAMLGHWWTVNGAIALGERRGRRIGFPTSNIAFGESIVPAFGVYAVRARVEGAGQKLFDGAANLGVRPTFGEGNVLLEAHLFDFNGEHYGRHIQVHFVGRLRPERKFADIDALKAQIAKDCEAARVLLADPENAHDRLPPPTLDAYLAAHPVPF